MTSAELSFLEERLISTEAHLLELLAPIVGEQWTFRETSERWSLSENLEHLVLFELFIRKTIAKILSEPAYTGDAPAIDDAHVMALREVGTTKLISRDVALPKNSLGTLETLLHRFQRERAKTITFARSLRGDLRAHRFAHLVLGELDAYQWLLVIAQHTERHIAQMKAVMADPHFPR